MGLIRGFPDGDAILRDCEHVAKQRFTIIFILTVPAILETN